LGASLQFLTLLPQLEQANNRAAKGYTIIDRMIGVEVRHSGNLAFETTALQER
jgi:hypothetical protein